jgi:hypothetical protein
MSVICFAVGCWALVFGGCHLSVFCGFLTAVVAASVPPLHQHIIVLHPRVLQ